MNPPLSSDRAPNLELSVIIPFYNEEGNIDPLMRHLLPVLISLDATYEVLLIDDGSTDATPGEIAAITHREPSCRMIRFFKKKARPPLYLKACNKPAGACWRKC